MKIPRTTIPITRSGCISAKIKAKAEPQDPPSHSVKSNEEEYKRTVKVNFIPAQMVEYLDEGVYDFLSADFFVESSVMEAVSDGWQRATGSQLINFHDCIFAGIQYLVLL